MTEPERRAWEDEMNRPALAVVPSEPSTAPESRPITAADREAWAKAPAAAAGLNSALRSIREAPKARGRR